jgi:CO/xanthine dehydrogenase Mo-binding subunit
MKKFGRGLATIMFGFGYGEGFPDHSIASIEIKEDERIVIRTAAADVGQGVITTVIQIAAEILRISPNYFEVVQGDTHKTKNSGSTSATRQTYFTGNAVKKAAEDMLANLYHYGSLEFRSNHPEIAIEDGKIYMYDDPDDYITYWEMAERVKERGERLEAEGSFFPVTYSPDKDGQADKVYVAYTFLSQVIDIEVDTDTGTIDLLDVYTAVDLGKAINPKNVEGQIEGGTVQGLGMGMMEDQVIRNGKTLNAGMTDYLVPTSVDVPNFKHYLVEEEDSEGPFGAKGVGEPTLIAAAPALANAVYDAIGVRFFDLPISPSKIKKALKEKEKEENS